MRSWRPRTRSRCSSTAIATAAHVDQEAVANVRMVLHDLAEGVVPVAPVVAPSYLSAPARVELPAEGAHRYKIELPQVAQRDIDALVDELGLMGRISVAPLDGGRTAVIITTQESLDDIIAICSFVLDPDDLKIFEAPALTPEQRADRSGRTQADRRRPGLRLLRPGRRRRACRRRTIRRRTRLRLLPADRADPRSRRHRRERAGAGGRTCHAGPERGGAPG